MDTEKRDPQEAVDPMDEVLRTWHKYWMSDEHGHIIEKATGIDWSLGVQVTP